MFYGKNKAITFSFDDGISQDYRLIKLMNKYGLKGTFNINSGRFGDKAELILQGESILRNRITASEVEHLYKGHEVAAHTLTHQNLTQIKLEDEIVFQVEEDRKALSRLVGYEVCGMAYPGSGINNNVRVAEIIKKRTGIKYCRGGLSTKTFELQENLYQYNPTVHLCGDGFDIINELADEFLRKETREPQVFFVFGHSYEFDVTDNWDRLASFFEKIAFKSDIYYGTNKDVLLNN